MIRLAAILLSGLALAQARAQDWPPVAGSTAVDVAFVQVRDVALGLSARKQIFGRPVVNEQGQALGQVVDLIVAPDMAVSWAIVDVNVLHGVSRRHVAIAADQFTRQNDVFLLPGATPELVESLPAFDYAEPDAEVSP
jgi:hypothetical protein